MFLFSTHALILLVTSFGAARCLIRPSIDRILVAGLLAWGNIVATCLTLSTLHHLGEAAWFFPTSVALSLATWLLLRLTRPEPTGSVVVEKSELRPSKLLVAAFIVTLAPLAYISIRIAGTYVPNNYDSLTYHLPRAMFYMGQDTLAHFDTGNDRQIYFPFNFNLLQLFGLIYSPPLQCLTFLNLASWSAAGLAVYRLSRLCALSANSALIASWFALTSTQIFAQATSTTNDLPTGAGLLCALMFALRWRQTGLTRDALLAGLAAGLAIGTKLTVVFFVPPAGLLVVAWGFRHWRESRLPAFFAGIRAWVPSALLALAVSSPFALINLAEKGQWMSKVYDYTLNRPFSFSSAAQTTKAYLLQLFLEPLHRFSFNPNITALLNEWGERTFFPHWNSSYAFSDLYLFPPDLNEDHVWFGFTGPLILVCALICLVRWRKFTAPIAWLAWLGLGWFAAYLLLNKWSLYNQRYFVPAILIMSPCLGALFEIRRRGESFYRITKIFFAGLAISSLWLAGVYLLKNTRRPYAPLWAGQTPPPALPVLPPLLAQRLSAQPRVNINATDGNERIFLLMTQDRHQRFTSFTHVDPSAYNVFSEWGFTRKVAYSNIEQISSYTTVAIPTKRTAGVEFLGTIGEGTGAQDYYGLVPNAENATPSESNRNVLVTIEYASGGPNRYLHSRIHVVGLNPADQALLNVGVEYDDGTVETMTTFTHNGAVPVAITKPFRRFTVRVEDLVSGNMIGAVNVPFLIRTQPPEYGTPFDASTIFTSQLIANNVLSYISSEGLSAAEGPYPQWGLPLIRWVKAPVVRLGIPGTEDLVHLRMSFSLRTYVREHAGICLMFNDRLVKYYQIDDHNLWLDETLDFTAATGMNVLEFRNVALGSEPDWLDYLERYPDVMDSVIARHIPLEQGAREHYQQFGKKENRILHLQHGTEPATTPDSLYYIFRQLQVEGRREP